MPLRARLALHAFYASAPAVRGAAEPQQQRSVFAVKGRITRRPESGRTRPEMAFSTAEVGGRSQRRLARQTIARASSHSCSPRGGRQTKSASTTSSPRSRPAPARPTPSSRLSPSSRCALAVRARRPPARSARVAFEKWITCSRRPTRAPADLDSAVRRRTPSAALPSAAAPSAQPGTLHRTMLTHLVLGAHIILLYFLERALRNITSQLSKIGAVPTSQRRRSTRCAAARRASGRGRRRSTSCCPTRRRRGATASCVRPSGSR